MHQIHHTEGLILSSRNSGESGKYYHIFTRDLGLLIASAQGVRKMSSKLRYILQDFSYVKIDFVQGKDFWRVTSASKTAILENLARNTNTFSALSNITRLLKRLLAGEEANPALFEDVMQGLSILQTVTAKEELANVEAVIVLRILSNLGYIGGNETLMNLIRSPLEMALMQEVSKQRVSVLSLINKTLKETHL